MILNSKIQEIKGIGPYYTAILNQNDIRTCSDLLWLFPTKHEIFSATNNILQNINQIAVLNLTIKSVLPKTQTRKITLVIGKHEDGHEIYISFFAHSKLFYVNNKICIFGELKMNNNRLTMAHPDWMPGHHPHFSRLEYPIEGIPPAIIYRSISSILANAFMEEWLPNSLLETKNWPSFINSLKILHSYNNSQMKILAAQRLVFDEALAYYHGLQNAQKQAPDMTHGHAMEFHNTSDIMTRFGHEFTKSQQDVWNEIIQDLASHNRTMRLIYGDVGSGKTVIALRAMVMCYRGGKQAALLAPTAILANQHYQLLKTLLPNENIILLTGKTKSKSVYQKIANENCIIIGTHAILQEKVHYKSLGLLVIDEQHRFGVLQRMAIDQSIKYNVLFMTATPIPRTYELLTSGAIPVSKITMRPQSHRDIDIRIVSKDKTKELLSKIQSLLDIDDNIFWVCPFIKKSKRQGMDILSRAAELKEIYGDLVGIIHGQMSAAAKDDILEQFNSNQIRILVSTTVIEVGINIPHANTMIIENAELFGIAQLYQLLGRVGRGTKPGRCYFLYHTLCHDAKRRLLALKECKSGLDLAEHDAYIRGFGNILGTEQSGRQIFRIFDPEKHREATEEVIHFIKNNQLESASSDLLKTFGYLYSPWYGG